MPQDREREVAAALVSMREALAVLDAAGLHQAAAHLSLSIHVVERHFPEPQSSQEPDS
jgi:hypothetical protein